MEVFKVVQLCVFAILFTARGAYPVISIQASHTIPENLSGGTTIIAGITADQAVTMWSLTGTDKDHFTISPTSTTTNSDSVSIATKANTVLDFETVSSYAFTISATNAGSETGTKAITVTLTDVNEAPSFAVDGYGAKLSLWATGGTTVLTVTASDVDSGDVISYSLTDTNFEIDQTTGIIKIKSGVTLSTNDAMHFLVVTAADNDGTPLTGTITVFVCVGTCSSICSSGVAVGGAIVLTFLAMVAHFV